MALAKSKISTAPEAILPHPTIEHCEPKGAEADLDSEVAFSLLSFLKGNGKILNISGERAERGSVPIHPFQVSMVCGIYGLQKVDEFPHEALHLVAGTVGWTVFPVGAAPGTVERGGGGTKSVPFFPLGGCFIFFFSFGGREGAGFALSNSFFPLGGTNISIQTNSQQEKQKN